MNGLRVSHLSLGVANLDASEAFYRDVLGLPTQREGEDVRVHWPDFTFILTERPPADRSKFHFGFRVPGSEQVDSWAERLRSHNAQIISGPAGENGARRLFFLDPDQYVVEIYAE